MRRCHSLRKSSSFICRNHNLLETFTLGSRWQSFKLYFFVPLYIGTYIYKFAYFYGISWVSNKLLEIFPQVIVLYQGRILKCMFCVLRCRFVSYIHISFAIALIFKQVWISFTKLHLMHVNVIRSCHNTPKWCQTYTMIHQVRDHVYNVWYQHRIVR